MGVASEAPRLAGKRPGPRRRHQWATSVRQSSEVRSAAPQVDAITRAAKDLTPDQQQELDTDDLIESARRDPADVFAAKVRREAERIKGDHGLADTKKKQAASRWRHWFDERSGMGRIHAEFDPERYESIVNAVESHLGRLANQGGVNKTPNLTATAAHELLTGVTERGSGRPHINLVVDWHTFTGGAHATSVRETCGGHLVPPETISRLACDATIQRIVLDSQSVPINVGRRHRTATDSQWQAIRATYRSVCLGSVRSATGVVSDPPHR